MAPAALGLAYKNDKAHTLLLHCDVAIFFFFFNDSFYYEGNWLEVEGIPAFFATSGTSCIRAIYGDNSMA